MRERNQSQYQLVWLRKIACTHAKRTRCSSAQIARDEDGIAAYASQRQRDVLGPLTMWEAPRVREALICAPLLGVERVAFDDMLATRKL
ncbi:transporter [Pseudozyma hubeiensis SY62]|uniref:Transporter n=1 Tax=Pseudozyma hubeiensis (strain SY62) TaxID=1305764 RepID=R9P243_PSEHS|nr:transporter [Pseudozyma hubeiensis SY62]GAC95341.1 transporter [Pseudozyma hubeiensis SY62]